jgi:hypothetical protein
MEMSVRADPAPVAYGMTVIDKTGGLARSALKLILVGQDGYAYAPAEQKWLKVPMQSQSGLTAIVRDRLDPNRLAGSAPAAVFSHANLVGNEQVNGVNTAHYRTSGSLLQQFLAPQIGTDSRVVGGQADFWVAEADSYLKQYTLDATLLGKDGTQVRETARLLVSDENQPVQIEAPAPDQVTDSPLLDVTPAPAPAQAPVSTVDAAQATINALPAPPGSQIATLSSLPAQTQSALQAYVNPTGARLIYASSASVADLAAFYHQQMPALGWSEVMSTPAGGGRPALGMYGKNDRNLMLVIMPDPAMGGRSLVLLQF